MLQNLPLLRREQRINVPLFINEGDKIKIDTEKAAYLERAKE